MQLKPPTTRSLHAEPPESGEVAVQRAPEPSLNPQRHARPTICQIVHCLSVGGAELLAADISRRLSHRYRFVFVCLDELGPLGGALLSEGFPVHVLSRRPGIDFQCARRLAALFREERAAAVHAHQYTPFFQAAVARGLRTGPPILFTEHGRHYPDTRKWKRVIANKLLTGRRDRIVGVGEAVRGALVRNEGFAESRVGVVYNGVDLDAVGANRETARRAVRDELDLEESFVILQIARLNRLKDHPTALAAFERVLTERPDARLVLAGDGDERAAIESIIRDKGLQPFVRVLGTRRDVPQLLAAADVFLLSSISEGIPLTLIEAMGAEVPIVSTDVGGISEMIRHGTTGFLAPAGDAAGLARYLLQLANDAALRRQFAMAAHTEAHARFSRQTMDDAYITLYEGMIHG
ncbi:MAG: glycosyltransferase [Planctomycetaceae bacterium]|nr:glycosyltransferase [Planctomycetaceae bacterium]